MRNLCLIGFAVVSVVLVTSAQAQHLGSRQQWQPQTESDPRLQQPVQLEIIGRAAITGLPILSEKTGVSLSVAPEDLSTVGERKFTVIAQGCSLKAIMVQLEEALQECHWDVDATGKGPVYLLHRNAGVDEAAEAGLEAVVAARRENRRARCEERVAAARKALAMSLEELKELEKSDLFLARGVRQPVMRATLEGLLSLSEEQLRRMAETGAVRLTYAQATPQLQRATVLALENMIRGAQQQVEGGAGNEETGPTQAEVAGWRKMLSRELPADTSILFYPNSRGEIVMSVRPPAQPDAPEWNGDAYAVLSRYPVFPNAGAAKKLLADTGDTAASTDDLVRAWWKRGKEEQEAEQARRDRAQHKALPPEFGQLIPVGSWEELSLTGFQQKIAATTGLSLISDWFSGQPIYSDSALPPDPVALSRALDKLALMLGFVWDANGRCLTFHRTQWYYLAQQEVPELLVEAYRERLHRQGRFTLEDVVALAATLQGLRTPPAERMAFFTLPHDLAETGVGDLIGGRPSWWCVSLLASLTPALRAKAESERGLAFQDMSRRQQAESRRVATTLFAEHGDARARESALGIRTRESIADGHYYTTYRIELEIPGDPSWTSTAEVHLRGGKAPAEALPPSE